jgi:hypothetical protein
MLVTFSLKMKVQLFKSNDVFREYDKPFGGD